MKRKRDDLFVLGGLILLGLLLGRLQASARNAGRTDLLSHFARLGVSPAAGVIGAGAYAARDFFGAIGSVNRLEAANRRLREIARVAQDYGDDIDRLSREIDELRKQGGWLGGTAREKAPADVTGFFPHESRLSLDVGADQGIKRGMPVATYEGMLGRVETVDRSTCQVLLLTSPASTSRISAVVRDQSRGDYAAGLIHGDGVGLLSIELADPNAKVSLGDVVTTPGFSEEIPRGIVIGRIVDIQDDKAFGRRTATIKQSASLGEIREVLVIK